MTYFTTGDGTRLFYEDWGDGRPIVLVSTWAMNSGMWENQVPFLTPHGLRCVTYDRRGTRRSDEASDGYDTAGGVRLRTEPAKELHFPMFGFPAP